MALVSMKHEADGDRLGGKNSFNLESTIHESAFVTVGDFIGVDEQSGFLRGHGTQLTQDGKLTATVCGTIERVNKLISVRPFKSRYTPETGDVVVGRVTEVAEKRWKIDINAPQGAQLLLSAVNLPGGIQRRRTAVDELNMRSLYTEGDLISAEIQSSHQDGSATIHTRSVKYGKLADGQLVQVPPYLIKRMKQHFTEMKSFGIHIILGCNGYAWIGAPPPPPPLDEDEAEALEEETNDVASLGSNGAKKNVDSIQHEPVSLALREKICRCAMAIRALGRAGFPIFPAAVEDTYNLSVKGGVGVKDMVGDDFVEQIIAVEVERRNREDGVSPMEM